MTEAERCAFEAGIDAARELIERTARGVRREATDKAVADIVTMVLDELSDGLTVLKQASCEAQRQALALVQA